MAETISMEVNGKASSKILSRIYGSITPKYVAGLLGQHHMPSDEDTVGRVTTSYRTFPTEDLALKVFETEQGVRFWGIASGGGSRLERAAVKYLILEYIQEQLQNEGIHSEINIAGLNKETIAYMRRHGMFKGKLPILREIAKKRGNLDDIFTGAYAALRTPV